MGRFELPSSATTVLLLLILPLLERPCLAQLSKPVAHDDNMKETMGNNKFAQREATDDSSPLPYLDEEALANTQCPQQVELRWQTEVGSSIYATPLITDLNGDGKLEIVVPTFVHYLEVLEGADGEKLAGWPAQHQSTVHASALVYDIDKDGSNEIALATFNGEVLFYRAGGYLLPDKLIVPRLKVRKEWYVGLNPDPVDRSHPDVHDESLVVEQSNSGTTKKEETHENLVGEQNKPGMIKEDTDENLVGEENKPGVTKKEETETIHKEELSDDVSTLSNGTVFDTTNDTEISLGSVENETTATTDRVNEMPNDSLPNSIDVAESKVESTIKEDVVSAGDMSDLLSNSHDQSQEGNLRRRLLQAEGTTGDGNSKTGNEESTSTESKAQSGETGDAVPTVENPQDPMGEDAQASFDIFKEEDENGEEGLTEEYAYDYDDYVNADMWGDEDWDVVQHEKMEDFVEVDPHILATPVIVDIDKDGVDEMVIAVSYFYDREYYESSDHAQELGENLDISKYVAGGIVVFNLETKQVKWDLHLDQSTDTTTFRAYIYSSPTIVDLDGDGYMDIIVGTSIGYVYVIDHTGQNKKNFPLLMGEIQGQVVAADVNDDGKIEIVTTDSRGNVAAWTGEGVEIWEVHLKSLISQSPTVGDVDGDGHTDIVVPTTSGRIYVLRGSDGKQVAPYPFRTHGRVMAPALLVDLSKRGAEKKGLTIAIGSFDGYFYLIDGPTGCAEAIDIGETSYSMALADNVDGGDDLDIIVTTMNGNVYCFQTAAPHHPLKAWPMQTQGRNVFASRYQREGIYVVPSSRRFRDEAGDTFHVTFEIVDKHVVPSGTLGPYTVTVSLLSPHNYRGNKRFQYNYTYEQPGVYTVVLSCLSTRTAGSVVVEMIDKNSLYFSDEFALTFHMHYYRLLKWLLTLPLLGMTGMFLAFRPREEGAPLPSFSTDRHQL